MVSGAECPAFYYHSVPFKSLSLCFKKNSTQMTQMIQIYANNNGFGFGLEAPIHAKFSFLRSQSPHPLFLFFRVPFIKISVNQFHQRHQCSIPSLFLSSLCPSVSLF
jgi:hypothetical protein